MAEELPLPLPLPLPVTSDTSSLCLNRSSKDDDQHYLGNNSSQKHTFTLSPPLPATREAPVNGSHETRFVNEQSIIRSPKKPKRSPSPENPTSFLQEIEMDEERGNFPENIEGFRGSCEDSRVSEGVATETSGGNLEFVQISDQLLNFDDGNEIEGSKLEKKKLDSGENEVSVECVELNDGLCAVKRVDTSNFEALGASCKNCPAKQSVEFESERKSGNFEGNGSIVGSCGHGSENQSVIDEAIKRNLLNAERNYEVGESEPEESLNGDALACSQKTELSNQTAAVDSSKIVAAGASNGGARKFVYSRKEMEALRFVNVKAQKKFWQAIHNGLQKTIKREYDELGNFRKHQKHVNRHQNADMRDYSAQGILGESFLEGPSCDSETMSSMDLTCNASNNEDSNDLEEECSEQEESSDEYESIQRPAFLVEGEPDFESGPPEDGLEYLRRVRWEAAHIPKVKVAKIDNSKLKQEQSVYMPKIPKIEECPPHLAPWRQWEDEFLADFSELRLALSRLDNTCDTSLSDPQSIIFGPNEHKNHPSKSRSLLELPKGGPTLSTVLAMELATRVAMLKRHISLFENASNLSKDDCAWLFALCAAVDTPLDADTCASLRCLLRRCAKLRAKKSELDDEVVMLNVLATISGKFFRQSEN